MSAPRDNPWKDRHPSVAHFERAFQYAHLPAGLQDISEPFARLADTLLDQLNDGPELSTALRKLREAKDCAVLQKVIDADGGARHTRFVQT